VGEDRALPTPGMGNSSVWRITEGGRKSIKKGVDFVNDVGQRRLPGHALLATQCLTAKHNRLVDKLSRARVDSRCGACIVRPTSFAPRMSFVKSVFKKWVHINRQWLHS